MPDVDIGQGHAVKGVVLAGRVNGHVAKKDQVPHVKGPVKGIVPNDVPCKAGRTAKAVRVRRLSRFLRTIKGRTVGHFNDVRHMAGRARIKDGKLRAAIFPRIKNAGRKIAGA